MPASSPWNSVAFGLTLKLVAMWMILPALLIPFVFPSHLGLLFAVLLPLLIDLVGRCYCAWSPVAGTLNIRLSILAQITGVLGLTATSLFLGPGGVIFGLAWAAVFQVSAAKCFIKHLRAIALDIGQPTIAVGLDQLRQRLIATSLSFYGSGMISVVVLSCAVVFGLMTFGLGFIITIPNALQLRAVLERIAKRRSRVVRDERSDLWVASRCGIRKPAMMQTSIPGVRVDRRCDDGGSALGQQTSNIRPTASCTHLLASRAAHRLTHPTALHIA